MLLDILSEKFKKIVCVFMYMVEGLEYEEKYIDWSLKKYKNAEFIKVPHYSVASFIKHGYLGIKKDGTYKKNKISLIDKKIRTITGINYSVYGFKKIDGITRRLMLNDTPTGINDKTQKAYPLMDLKNQDVLNYIEKNNLIRPFNYGTRKPSSGCDISTPEYLDYIRRKHPRDLEKIFKQYPFTEINLFKFLNYENKAI